MTPQPSPPTSEVQSPLTLEKTDTISELFQRDPLEWTDAQLDRAIEELRAQRKNFLSKPAKVEKKPAISKEQVAALSTNDLLSKLGL